LSGGLACFQVHDEALADADRQRQVALRYAQPFARPRQGGSEVGGSGERSEHLTEREDIAS
jgi:hypothetical protein